MSNLSKTIAILGVVAGLGVAALPLSTYAADPDPVEWNGTGDASVPTDTTVTLTIKDTLSIDTDAEDVALNSTNSYTGTPLNVKVITNNSKGYTLKIAGTATSGNVTDLTSTTVSTDTILASANGIDAAADLAVESGNSVWGYSLTGDNLVSSYTAGKFAGVKGAADADTIAESNTATGDAGKSVAVTFKAALKDGQPAGTYKGKVTFTAANQPNA